MVELVPTLREFNQFEARLYDARIMRWNVPDPAGQFWSPYNGMGNDWINGVDPDGRYLFRSIAERQRQRAINQGLDPSPLYKNGTHFKFNYFYEGEIVVKRSGGIPLGIGVWGSDGMLNTMHPTYARRQMKNARNYKYWNQQGAWEEDDGLREKGIPTLTAAITFATGVGLFYYAEIGIGGLTWEMFTALNSANAAAGNPLLKSFKKGDIPPIIIDGTSLITDFLSPTLIPIMAPEIIMDIGTVYSDVHKMNEE